MPRDYLETPKGGNVWSVSCRTCAVELLVDASTKDLFDAYDAYSKALDSGALDSRYDGPAPAPLEPLDAASPDSRTIDRWARPKSAVRQTKEEIEKLIRLGGLTTEEVPFSVLSLLNESEERLVHYRHLPPTDALYGSKLPDLKLPTKLKEHLISKGVEQLYAFQNEAFDRIGAGHNAVVVAPTAQGKTEAFILPLIRNLLITIQDSFRSPGIRALLIYPTKALARDQFEKIKQMCKASGLTAALFDGDVSQSQRRRIYERPPDLLLTNPDVLHYHLGWEGSQLVPLLSTVRHVVIDEIHLYTGSLGANVYYILKRLGLETDEPFQMIGASATIANPREHTEQLFDSSVELIESQTAKRGPIHFMMYYPERSSKYSMIVNLVRRLNEQGFRTLVFGNTHSEAELLNRILGRIGVSSKVHRGGLSKSYRSKVEEEFKSGRLPVLVSTPTLELGIDIGHLDCVVSMIVSVTRLTQRIGRAGRKGQESVAILALRDNDPISTFYRFQPEKYFTDIDSAYVEPGNEIVARYQLIAAAMSGKMNTADFPYQLKVIKNLQEEGLVQILDDGQVRVVDMDRARKEWRGYNIRGIGDTVEIRLGNKLIGDRSMPMAAQELHPGALYLHGGETYMSVQYDYRQGFGRAKVVKNPDSNEHTRPMYYSSPRIVEVLERHKILGMKTIYCTLEMTQVVHGYTKVQTYPRQVLGQFDLSPDLVYKYLTRGFAFAAPSPSKSTIDEGLEIIERQNADPAWLVGGAFHALEHVVIESSGMLTGGSTREIGGVSMGDSGIIFVHDGSPGGSGASRLLYKRLDEAFRRVEAILANCECEAIDGCPLCTYSYQCGNNNSPLFKNGALDSVRQILERSETDVDTEGYIGYQPMV
ncbi:MAG: DEAD/DEAH box helicase [Candidatus Thorarchaeota archaeon]|nr:MAG: DEAD/DEAH box helicase [Candidatus Thorarchaeota archaeon]